MNSNFYAAFFLLSKQKRRALRTLYAYCRHIDDIVDETDNRANAQQLIDEWKKRLDHLHHLSPSDPPLAFELSELVKTYSVRVEDLFWILKGVEIDLQKDRFENFEDLIEYCDGVASAVGLAMLPILGADRDDCYAYAMATGRALQLTNILRDISSDLEKGRIYLPKEDLARFGYTERHLQLQIYNDRFVDMMNFQVSRTLGFHIQAEKSIPTKDRKFLVSAEAMRNIYMELLKKIHARHYRVFPEKIQIPTYAKVRVFCGHLMDLLFPKAI